MWDCECQFKHTHTHNALSTLQNGFDVYMPYKWERAFFGRLFLIFISMEWIVIVNNLMA